MSAYNYLLAHTLTMHEKHYKLYVISSPSGGGKTSLIKELFLDNESKSLSLAVSDTTRKMRKGDRNGVDYNFLSNQEFNEKIEEDEYLEFAEVFDNFYGTSKKAVNTLLKNTNVLLELDWQGAYAVKKIYQEASLIFLVPPSIADLEERLKKRNLDSNEDIEKRVKEAKNEIKKCINFDYLILNDDFERALNEIKLIIFKNLEPKEFYSRVEEDLLKSLVD